MINKLMDGAAAALADVPDGATILVAGFGESGCADHLLEVLLAQGAKDLTLVSNNVGYHDYGMGALIGRGRVRKMISTFPNYAGATAFRERFLAGTIELELVPQGTLAERIRAGGAGLGGFFTPTGAETDLAAGKEARVIDGVPHVFEKPIWADYAFIRARTADRWGNLRYWRSQRNYNPMMATAAKVTIAEVDEVVPLGDIDPDLIHTPGVFVHRMVLTQTRAQADDKG